MRDIIAILPPASRRTDPDSSYSAEAEINKSGTRVSQQQTIFKALFKHEGSTSMELTKWCALDRYQIARRLSDLKSAGFVRQGSIRVCKSGGRKSVTWFTCHNMEWDRN
jgi:predicted HTH transcriptional regulator